MNLCKTILKNAIYDLELSDIVGFFSIVQEETSVLEFKSGDVTLEQIHREVSAFLNTEGGLLILGAPTEKKVGSVKVCIGDLKPCLTISSQDTLLRSIASNIAPSPLGIKAKSFNHEGGMVFVLEIPQSMTPPHQASNEGKYYIRLERDAKPAPHGIVEALFNRRQTPNLLGEIEFLLLDARGEVRITFNLTNQSIISAERVGIMINIDGVKEVKRIKNLREPRLKDDKLTIQELLDNNLLVQGISLRFSLEVSLRNPFGFVNFSYYCKDAKLQTRQRLFTTNPKEIVKRYDSDTTLDSDSDLKVISEEFRLMQENRVRAILVGQENNTLLEPASLMDIYELEDSFGIELPDSYVAFFEITNGYSGCINGKELNLCGIEDLKKLEVKEIFEIDPVITVGFLGNYPILLKFEGDKDELTSIFTWGLIEESGSFVENDSTSFYGFLESIESA